MVHNSFYTTFCSHKNHFLKIQITLTDLFLQGKKIVDETERAVKHVTNSNSSMTAGSSKTKNKALKAKGKGIIIMSRKRRLLIYNDCDYPLFYFL